MTPEQEQKLNEIYAFMQQMKDYASMPRDIPIIIGKRLGVDKYGQVSTATKAADSEDQAVNEGGSSTYNVLKSPDGFLLVRDGNGNALGFTPYYS